MDTASTAPVECRASDGTVLRGVLWSGDADGALLLHDDGHDLDSLTGIAEALAATGFTVLAIDRRGHGASDGEPGGDVDDGRLALEHLRTLATRRLAVVAVGGAARSGLGLRNAPSVVAMALVSPGRDSADPLVQPSPAGAPIHIVVGGHDPGTVEVAERLRDGLGGYCAVARIPTTDQGSELLVGAHARLVTGQVRAFLASHR